MLHAEKREMRTARLARVEHPITNRRLRLVPATLPQVKVLMQQQAPLIAWLPRSTLTDVDEEAEEATPTVPTPRRPSRAHPQRRRQCTLGSGDIWGLLCDGRGSRRNAGSPTSWSQVTPRKGPRGGEGIRLVEPCRRHRCSSKSKARDPSSHGVVETRGLLSIQA